MKREVDLAASDFRQARRAKIPEHRQKYPGHAAESPCMAAQGRLCRGLAMQRWRQRQPVAIRGGAKEGFDLLQVPAVSQADEESRRALPQQPVKRDAHGQVAAAAEAAGRNANDVRRSGAQRGERIKPAGQAFKQHGRGSGLIRSRYPCANRSFTHCGSRARDERGAARHALRWPRPGSTPSCLSLRYRCVRSSPVRSATRVMLPFSRCR